MKDYIQNIQIFNLLYKFSIAFGAIEAKKRKKKKKKKKKLA